jgi:hypothetical protein
MENPHTKEREKQVKIRIKELQKQGAKILEVYVCLYTKNITIHFEFEGKKHTIDFDKFSVDLQKTIKKNN